LQLQQLMDLPDELERQLNAPTRAYVRDRRAMANTPMDVKELPSGATVLAVDMPGVSPADVKVQVEEGNVLTISGERKRPAEDGGAAEGKQQAAAGADGEKQGVKYLRMERRMGKFMRRFPLPESADLDSIRAAYKDGVLTVTVDKKPPPEPKKPRVVQVTLGEQQGKQGGEATYA
jgi:HSP20 family protein